MQGRIEWECHVHVPLIVSPVGKTLVKDFEALRINGLATNSVKSSYRN
jgi:hypothetical protein